MTVFEREYDVVVVGAGPSGAASGLAFARDGARVLVLEANPKAARRLAGEWLHPPGVSVLDQLGLDPYCDRRFVPVRGFVVFPDDGGGPVKLPYADGAIGLAREHADLVDTIREHLGDHDGATYVTGSRVTRIEGHVVRFTHAGQEHSVQAAVIVGADGRSSVVRSKLGFPDHGFQISHMGSVELRDVDLPVDEYGHVILGGPGPCLFYRIDDDRVRLCLDLPVTEERPRNAATLWASFGPLMPTKVRASFRRALETQRVQWAMNRFRPRSHYGAGHIALVGDAVGFHHPITATGITLGLRDAECLVRTGADVDAYARERESKSYVAELLANALYQVFTRDDATGLAIREAVYQVWRGSSVQRDQTMRILADMAGRTQFTGSFVSIAFAAVTRRAMGLGANGGSWLEMPWAVAAFGEWMKWPAASVLPRSVRKVYRSSSTATAPIPWIETTGLSPERRRLGTGREVPADRWRGRPSVTRPGPVTLGAREASLDADWAWCVESLEAVSRTFSRPIAVLPGNLRKAVTCGYLLCRIADTIEDHPTLPIRQRDRLYGRLLTLLEDREGDEGLAKAFLEVPGDDAELRLARSLPRVLRVFRTLPEPLQRTCERWVAEMTRGMQVYSHRTPGTDGVVALHTLSDLERYCYFVAGTVGHMLTELFLEEMPEATPQQAQQLRSHAEAFGMGLQLTNILKDVTDDRVRRWSFIPREVCAAQGINVAELTIADRRAAAHAAVEPVFEAAAGFLDRALTYTLAIPATQPEVRLFCLLPLWMAVRTLVHARGNDAMFTAEEPVKISRTEVEQLIAECMGHVADDDALRARYRALWAPARNAATTASPMPAIGGSTAPAASASNTVS